MKAGSIPATVVYIILLNGILLSSLQVLYVGAIKKPLLNGSIPSNVSTLFLLDEFNQKISEILPRISVVYVGDIHSEEIPLKSTIQINKSPSCKQQFNNSNYVYEWEGCKEK